MIKTSKVVYETLGLLPGIMTSILIKERLAVRTGMFAPSSHVTENSQVLTPGTGDNRYLSRSLPRDPIKPSLMQELTLAPEDGSVR